MVIFPLFIWVAQYLERRRWSTVAIAGGAVLLGLFSAMYAVGPWIA
jgi:peptidoglycan/LPS O-acetylase OafA/YrhL